MNEMTAMIAGVLLTLFLTYGVNTVMRLTLDRTKKRQRLSAATVLKEYGYTPQLYLPNTGITDMKLREALDEFAYSGYIVTDRNGHVVGKILPKPLKDTRLRLVVSNK